MTLANALIDLAAKGEESGIEITEVVLSKVQIESLARQEAGLSGATLPEHLSGYIGHRFMGMRIVPRMTAGEELADRMRTAAAMVDHPIKVALETFAAEVEKLK